MTQLPGQTRGHPHHCAICIGPVTASLADNPPAQVMSSPCGLNGGCGMSPPSQDRHVRAHPRSCRRLIRVACSAGQALPLASSLRQWPVCLEPSRRVAVNRDFAAPGRSGAFLVQL